MKKNAGFTLLELVTVIAIIGIISAIATPNVIQWLNNQKFNAATRNLNAFIQDVRLKAIKENTHKRIQFDDSNDRYREYFWDRQNVGWVYEDWQKLPAGITMSTPSFSIIFFDHRGMANANRRITLTGPVGQQLDVEIGLTGTSRITG